LMGRFNGIKELGLGSFVFLFIVYRYLIEWIRKIPPENTSIPHAETVLNMDHCSQTDFQSRNTRSTIGDSVRATMVVQVGEGSGVCEWNTLIDVVR